VFDHENESVESFEEMNLTYLWVFCGLVGGLITCVLVTIMGFFKYSMSIGVNIHNDMFRSLVRAPAKFFDDNPSGITINLT
jgi:ABC-type multidrug transport system fused ATPase/permease subunit